jgi:hypothetical protein
MATAFATVTARVATILLIYRPYPDPDRLQTMPMADGGKVG